MAKVIESCTWSLIGSSYRVWKIGVLTVMQPHEVEVILFQWKIDWKTLGRGHFCDILAKKKKKQKTFVLGLCPEILSRSNKQTNKNIAWFVYFYAIDKYLFNLSISFFFSHWDRVSLYLPGCPGTYFVDQAVLELRYPPGSASWVLQLKSCSTMTWLPLFLYSIYILIVTPIPFHLP